MWKITSEKTSSPFSLSNNIIIAFFARAVLVFSGPGYYSPYVYFKAPFIDPETSKAMTTFRGVVLS